jgi:hypothetical protein
MTLLALRYDTRRGRFGRVRSGVEDRRRDPVAAQHMEPMDLAREMKMQDLRERIARHAYRIDAEAVAGAIVERLVAGVRLDDATDDDVEAFRQCS